jgi:hypothetical protein
MFTPHTKSTTRASSEGCSPEGRSADKRQSALRTLYFIDFDGAPYIQNRPNKKEEKEKKGRSDGSGCGGAEKRCTHKTGKQHEYGGSPSFSKLSQVAHGLRTLNPLVCHLILFVNVHVHGNSMSLPNFALRQDSKIEDGSKAYLSITIFLVWENRPVSRR